MTEPINMSIHINALPGEIEPVVLLAGDPLRAQFIAENHLENVKPISGVRSIFFYTGTYKGKPLTIGASGMGCPSIGIYSYELYTEFNVECIIRIGTCGSYSRELKLMDLINASSAASESTYAKYAWGINEENIRAQGQVAEIIQKTGEQLGLPVKQAAIHSSDIFYRKEQTLPEIAAKYNCPVVEMESFALFSNAAFLQKKAACLLTVSDIIPTQEKISHEDREKSLIPMIQLALETSLLV